MFRLNYYPFYDSMDIIRYEFHYNHCHLTVFSFDLGRELEPYEISGNNEIKPRLKLLLIPKLFRTFYG